jgi:hypothetical protein
MGKTPRIQKSNALLHHVFVSCAFPRSRFRRRFLGFPDSFLEKASGSAGCACVEVLVRLLACGSQCQHGKCIGAIWLQNVMVAQREANPRDRLSRGTS